MYRGSMFFPKGKVIYSSDAKCDVAPSVKNFKAPFHSIIAEDY